MSGIDSAPRSGSATLAITSRSSSQSQSLVPIAINECMFGHVNQLACGGASKTSSHCNSYRTVPNETDSSQPERDLTCLARAEAKFVRLFAHVLPEQEAIVSAEAATGTTNGSEAIGNTVAVAPSGTRSTHWQKWCCDQMTNQRPRLWCSWSLVFISTLVRVSLLAHIASIKTFWLSLVAHSLTRPEHISPVCMFALSLFQLKTSSLWHQSQQPDEIDCTKASQSDEPDRKWALHHHNRHQQDTATEVTQVCQSKANNKQQQKSTSNLVRIGKTTRPQRSMRTLLLFALLVAIVQQTDANRQQLTILDIDAADEETSTSPFAKPNLAPKCQDEKSVCGYMQINSVGLSLVPMCSCKGRVECPLRWSPFDIQTVRHGNDFYKYCTHKPKLNPCKPDEIAYSSFGETDLITGHKIADVQRVHCLCPHDHIYKANKTMFEMLDSSYIYGTEQLCQKPPRCNRKQICMSITETAETTLEKRHCRCPMGKHCPRDFRMAFEKIQEDKGAIYNMRCVVTL